MKFKHYSNAVHKAFWLFVHSDSIHSCILKGYIQLKCQNVLNLGRLLEYLELFSDDKNLLVSADVSSQFVVTGKWVIYDPNIHYFAETRFKIPWLSYDFFHFRFIQSLANLPSKNQSHVIGSSGLWSKLSCNYNIIKSNNLIVTSVILNRCSVLITQKSVNNDEPPPSPNIKSNDLPKESSITSSEVSYGTDQNFS